MSKLLCSKKAVELTALFSKDARQHVRVLKGNIWNSNVNGVGSQGFGKLRTAVLYALEVKRGTWHTLGKSYQHNGFQYDYFYVVDNAALDELVMQKLSSNDQLVTGQHGMMDIPARIVDMHKDWHTGWLLAETVVRGTKDNERVIAEHMAAQVIGHCGEYVGNALIKQGDELLQRTRETVGYNVRGRGINTRTAEKVLQTQVFL